MWASQWRWMLVFAIWSSGQQGRSCGDVIAPEAPTSISNIAAGHQRPARMPQPPRTESASTEMERQVILEMTLARSQPKRYAGFLRQIRDYYEGNLFREPGRTAIITREGVRALDQAIAFLETTPPVGPLEWNEVLFLAARDHARDQNRTGGTGHVGSDGSTMTQRIERHGRWTGTAAENIEYGDSDARHIVINLIVDDGVAGRGHRRNIFNRDLKAAGSSIARHRTYRNVCVIDFAAAATSESGER